MAFRDDRQICSVVMVLWARSPSLRELWTLDGPTQLACQIREAEPGQRPGWCSSAHLLFDLGWTLWNSENPTNLGRLLEVLDGHHLRALGSLIEAMGDTLPGAVDGWLRQHSSPGAA